MDIISLLEESKIKYALDYPLSTACTFRVGGECSLALFPDSAEQIALCARICMQSGRAFAVIGKGSNTLFTDGKTEKVLIFTGGAKAVKIDGKRVYAEAGAALPTLCQALAGVGLGGLEFAFGIPGSVGGALFMNAGAYGGCVGDFVVHSHALDCDSGEITEIKEHGFGYRQSIYMQNKSLVCLDAVLELEYADSRQIKQKMSELAQNRRQKQPLEYPSAGSYFKRPEGDFAGRLIEVCGLKGKSVGGAQVSQKHAGFIINTGGATCADILALEELVRQTVKEQTGVTLCREVELAD